MSSYGVSPSLAGSDYACVDWFADNEGGPYNVRVSIAVTNVGTILGSTVITTSGIDAYNNGTACAYGLSPGTTYEFVLTIRKASDYSFLGTRTTYITTNPYVPPTGTVPNVIGQTQGDASYLIQNAGFSPSGSTTTSGANASNNGTVASQSPSGGTTLALGSTVSFVVYNYIVPTTTVPNVLGQSQSAAVSSINNAGLSASVSTQTSGATAGNNGTVASQSPGPGNVVEQGSTVYISVYNYVPPQVTVPNVIGQTQASATSSLQGSGFVVSANTTTSGATAGNNGTVASQSPGGGTSAALGSTVSITVYNYVPPTGTVPNVVGQALATASTNIQNAGFTVSSSTTTVGATSGNNGTVASQTPTGGTTANLGTNVSLTVYNYIPPTASVPNVVGQTQASATTTLQNAGFVVSIATTSVGANSSNNGTVSSQNPSGGSTANLGSTVTITVFTFNPPVWTDNVIVNSFAVGTAYSDSVSATNSPSYTITAGALPPGITLNSITGAISGTPTTAGVYSFTISASNSDGSVSVSYNGTTTALPVWSDQTLAAFSQGRAYSDSVVATNSPSYSVTAGTLPAGTSLNSVTGAITGTPTGTGAYSFTITATNVYGSITASFSGTIKLPPNWIDNQLGSFINGVDYSDSVSASNSPTYSVTAGTLPAGTSLNSSSGVVSGTPTGSVGTAYSFTITATNADGSIAQAFSGSIQPDLGGNLKLYADGAWSDKEVYAYDGANWVRGTVYVYNGTAWSKSVF